MSAAAALPLVASHGSFRLFLPSHLQVAYCTTNRPSTRIHSSTGLPCRFHTQDTTPPGQIAQDTTSLDRFSKLEYSAAKTMTVPKMTALEPPRGELPEKRMVRLWHSICRRGIEL
ncbi:unnamed protein product [Ectocarpus sp. 12 AP-2014]